MVTISWQVISLVSSVLVSFLGLLAGIIGFLIKRQVSGIERRLDDLSGFVQSHLKDDNTRRTEDERRWQAAEKALWQLQADLPKEYVRREDWIRFGGILELKLDAVHKRIDDLKGAVINARS